MSAYVQATKATCLVFSVVLDASTSAADRARFFNRMRRQMRRRSLIMSQTMGLCMVLAARDGDVQGDRHAVVNWLIDEPLVRKVVIMPPVSLANAIQDGFTLLSEDGSPLRGGDAVVAKRFLRGLLTGVLVQGIQHRRYWERL